MQAIANQKYIFLGLGSLIALAWYVLWLWGQSPYGRYLTHVELRVVDFDNVFVVLMVIIGWVLMIIAMMLPTSLLLVAIFHRLTRQRTDRVSLMVFARRCLIMISPCGLSAFQKKARLIPARRICVSSCFFKKL